MIVYTDKPYTYRRKSGENVSDWMNNQVVQNIRTQFKKRRSLHIHTLWRVLIYNSKKLPPHSHNTHILIVFYDSYLFDNLIYQDDMSIY